MENNQGNMSSIKNFIKWFRILIIVTACISIAEMVYMFFSDYPLSLPMDGTKWTKAISDFALKDRFVLFLIVEISTFLWFLVLVQFWNLCHLYLQKKFFTTANALCFKYIAWAIMGMALVDTFTIYVVGMYLTFRNLIPQMPNAEFFLLIEGDVLAVGIFFWLIAKIMERASLMQEETDLTI